MPSLAHPVARPILAGAAAAARVGAGGMLSRMAPFTHLFRHAFEIEALASVALDPNPGYRPAVIAAEAAAGGLGPHIRLLMIHDPEGVLRAFAPVRVPSLGERVAGLPRALTVTGLADATPLIDAAQPAAALALVEALSGFGGARFEGIAATGRTAACLVEAAESLHGVKAQLWPAGDRIVLDCADPKAVRARLDAGYGAELKSARAALSSRFGRLRMEKIVDEPKFARALARLHTMVGSRSAIGAVCLDTLARAQSDEMCLCLHRLKAGTAEIGMALGLVGAGAWWALAVGFDNALDAPMAPPVMAAMLANSLARDPQIRRAVGGADIATPAWQSEPIVGLAVGPAVKLDAIRAMSGLGSLMAGRLGH
jgi:hypothetical protein